MVSFEQAKQIALDKISPADLMLNEEATLEKPYGWYFLPCDRESGIGSIGSIGIGGFIVEKEDGRVFTFGSAYSLQRNLEQYEAGFKYDNYDLSIVHVHDLQKTLDLLLQLGLNYAIPNYEYGVIWRIPQEYSIVQIRESLGKLPCMFACQRFNFRYVVFKEIDKTRCCDYQLAEHRLLDPIELLEKLDLDGLKVEQAIQAILQLTEWVNSDKLVKQYAQRLGAINILARKAFER